jgi:hypothetical protein
MLNNNFMQQPMAYSMGAPVTENIVISPMGGQGFKGGLNFETDNKGLNPEDEAHPEQRNLF